MKKIMLIVLLLSLGIGVVIEYPLFGYRKVDEDFARKYALNKKKKWGPKKTLYKEDFHTKTFNEFKDSYDKKRFIHKLLNPRFYPAQCRTDRYPELVSTKIYKYICWKQNRNSGEYESSDYIELIGYVLECTRLRSEKKIKVTKAMYKYGYNGYYLYSSCLVPGRYK